MGVTINTAENCVCCGCSTLSKSPAVLMPFVADRAFGWKPTEIADEWGLRTLKNGMAYSVCNSMQCPQCDLVFLDIRPNESQAKALYQGYRGDDYVELRESYEPGYRERNDVMSSVINYVREIERFLYPHVKHPARILDYGGDTGRNAPFQGHNQSLHICDIGNNPPVDGAVSVDIVTARGMSYDLIVCSNVLEHVPYPLDVLADVRSMMDDETVLYIEVPCEKLVRDNGPSPKLHELKKHWHEHINFFSQNSIAAMLKATGLELVDYQVYESNNDASISHHFMVACRKIPVTDSQQPRKSKAVGWFSSESRYSQARVSIESYHEHHGHDDTKYYLLLHGAERELSQLSVPDYVTVIYAEQLNPLYHAKAHVMGGYIRCLTVDYMLDQGHDKIMVFDGDTEFFGSIDDLWDKLDEYDAIATPHRMYAPPRDGKLMCLEQFALCGNYNVGFVAFANTQNARQFVDWWTKESYDYPECNMSGGRFAEQGWFRFVGDYMDKVWICRDHGINFAFWRYDGDNFKRSEDGRWMTDGVPLRLFHYGALDFDDLGRVAVHHNRCRACPDLLRFFEEYRERVYAVNELISQAVRT